MQTVAIGQEQDRRRRYADRNPVRLRQRSRANEESKNVADGYDETDRGLIPSLKRAVRRK